MLRDGVKLKSINVSTYEVFLCTVKPEKKFKLGILSVAIAKHESKFLITLSFFIKIFKMSTKGVRSYIFS